MQHPRAQERHFRRLLVGNLFHACSNIHLSRVSCTDTVHIGPYLHTLSIQGHTEDRRRIIGALEAQNRRGALHRRSNKALSENHIHTFRSFRDNASDTCLSRFQIRHRRHILTVGNDHFTGIHPAASQSVHVHCRRNYLGREQLACRDDTGITSRRKFTDTADSVHEIAQRIADGIQVAKTLT